MKDKLDQFVDNTIGNFQEVSYKDAIYQCMDLVYEWVFVLNYPKSTIQHQYAYQVFKNPNANTKDYFDIIPNSPSFIPEDGDIGVFSGGVAGHIVICLGGGTTNTFKAYSQNDPLGSSPVIKTYSYTNFLGVLRPKVFEKPEINDQTKLPIINSNGNQMEVQAVRSALTDNERRITLLLAEKDALNVIINNLQTKLDNSDAQVVQLATQLANTSQNAFSDPRIDAIKAILSSKNFWWVKLSKIKILLLS